MTIGDMLIREPTKDPKPAKKSRFERLTVMGEK